MIVSELISVIIVVFNAKNTIKKTIDSILNQTYKNFEIVIIDGKSTDGTIELIKSYKEKIAYFKSEKDAGVYDAMNKGIYASKGDWIIFLGADDELFSSNIFENIFNNNKYSKTDFLYGSVILTSNKKKYGGEKNYMSLIEKNICHQSIFYRKKIFEKIGKFDLKYKILSDYDFNIKVFEDDSISKQYLHQIIAFYNNTGLSSYVIDKYFHSDILEKFITTKKESNFTPQLQQHHFYYGIINLCSGKLLLATKHLYISWVCGNRKLFYFLFTGKFILRILAFQKIKIR